MEKERKVKEARVRVVTTENEQRRLDSETKKMLTIGSLNSCRLVTEERKRLEIANK